MATDIIHNPPSLLTINIFKKSTYAYGVVFSVDADGAYFVKMEYEAHNKGVGALVMLPEGTLLSGGDRDRRVAAWDSLQNYKKITEVKV